MGGTKLDKLKKKAKALASQSFLKKIIQRLN